MIVKFDQVRLGQLATLFHFVASDENKANTKRDEDSTAFVEVVSVTPNNAANTLFCVSLKIIEWHNAMTIAPEGKIDPKYLLRVYDILSQQHVRS